MSAPRDVVIVGGGIAGASLACVLAERGIDVLVLEKTAVFRDENRGEMMLVWGVGIAQELGLFDTLVEAGAHTVPHKYMWSESIPSGSATVDLGSLIPGVGGALNMGHPQARSALVEAARARGARIERGVRLSDLTFGSTPSVTWVDAAGIEHTTRTRLIVGADGRRSAVRRSAGLAFRTFPETHVATGMLVHGEEIPMDGNTIAGEDGWLMLTFPQGNGFARMYHCFESSDRHRYAGPGGAERFLANSVLRCMPHREAWAGARRAGPIGTFPCNDTEAEVLDEGVALVGDAGGYNNYQIGQGLSLALADAQALSDALAGTDRWDPASLAPYALGRSERLGRVRALANLIMTRVDGFRPGSPRRDIAFDLDIGDALRALDAGFDIGPGSVDIAPTALDRALAAFERRISDAVADSAA